jgi:hypothetical protein
VHDQVPGLAAAAGAAQVVELEERRPGDETAVAQPGDQRDAAGDRDQARAGAGRDDGGGQVDQLAAGAPGPGGDHGQAAGPQQDSAAGQDLGEPGEELVQALVGEVGRILAVAVVVLADASFRATALLGLDLAVDGRAVRRRGDDQRGPPGRARREQPGKQPGVAADHLGGPGRALAAGAGHVGGGEAGPAFLVLDAEAVAAEVDRLDQGGADAAHRVGDQVAGLGVAGDRGGGDGGQHLGAAWRQRRAPRRLVTAPEGVPAPPGWAAPPGPQPPPPAVLAPLWRHIAPDGVVGLGAGGAAAAAAVSTVNFALRSPAEQDALAGAYGRWLNSLTGPVQVLVRAGQADLSAAVAALRETAPALPHPALEQAALEHAGFLEGLAAERDVLTRQALLVIREPGHGAGRAAGGTAAGRALQRAGEAARLLAGAGLQVSVLDGGQVTALLAACADPGGPPQPAGRRALPGQPVTAPGSPA